MKEVTVPFIKASALGNDFVILLGMDDGLNLSALSILLSDRREGVGCDQVIFIESTQEPKEFKVRFFNADGSEAEACGNGTRCVAKILMDQAGIEEVFLCTAGGYLQCKKADEGKIAVKMSQPQWNSEINLQEYHRLSDPAPVFVSLGNPHLVCFVEDVEHVATLGPLLEEHLYKIDSTFPQRVNVGFVNIFDEENINIRVWERGAGLTPACGSGACAAVIAAKIRGLVFEKVNVYQEGGSLQIMFNDLDLFMIGDAKVIYTGQIAIDSTLLQTNIPLQISEELYAGTITLVQISPVEPEENYEVFADFGEFGERKTTAALAATYEMIELFGKPIIGILSKEDPESFTLLGYLDEHNGILLMDRPSQLKNGERVIFDDNE